MPLWLLVLSFLRFCLSHIVCSGTASPPPLHGGPCVVLPARLPRRAAWPGRSARPRVDIMSTLTVDEKEAIIEAMKALKKSSRTPRKKYTAGGCSTNCAHPKAGQ